jgi:nucleotide-binding universal stress UspA family protein
MSSIVLGYVDAPGARAALDCSIELAGRFGDELLIVFAVAPPGASVGDEFKQHRQALEEIGRRVTAEALEQAKQAGVTAEVELPVEKPSLALMRLAQERDARYIVVGSRGESPIRGAILGSVPHKLLQVSGTPVLVVPSRKRSDGR